MTEVTKILHRIEQGDSGAADQLLPLVYDELRKLAAIKLADEMPGQTLQPTALVHEAYLRLVDTDTTRHWDSRGHFFSAAAESIRRILVDAARHKRSLRRGGGRRRVDLLDADFFHPPNNEDILELSEALDRLKDVDPRASEIVKLRVFAGMTIEELAQIQGVSTRTVKRLWAYGRAWLGRQLSAGADPTS